MAEKKGMFHSELSKLGPVEVLVKTDVMQSKFKGKLPYVVLECDDVERNLTLENDECAKAVEGLKGKRVTIEATGTREEARLIITNVQGGRSAAPQREERSPAAQTPPAEAKGQERPAAHSAPPSSERKPKDKIDQVIDLKVFLARRGNALALAAAETCRVVETFCSLTGVEFGEADKEEIKRVLCEKLTETTFTTLFITADRSGLLDDFPSTGKLAEVVALAKARIADHK